MQYVMLGLLVWSVVDIFSSFKFLGYFESSIDLDRNKLLNIDKGGCNIIFRLKSLSLNIRGNIIEKDNHKFEYRSKLKNIKRSLNHDLTLKIYRFSYFGI